MTDIEQYGVEENWSLPVYAGDCEDYALKKRKVLNEFFPDHVDEAMDQWLRENYTIHLPRKDMRPA